jgi:hypothetical protein
VTDFPFVNVHVDELSTARIWQLNLPLMVTQNNDANGTNFTVSIEASTGVTTGISAAPNLQGVLSHNRLRCVLDESTHRQVAPLVGKYALVVQCQ